jgi:hypothetical protein
MQIEKSGEINFKYGEIGIVRREDEGDTKTKGRMTKIEIAQSKSEKYYK